MSPSNVLASPPHMCSYGCGPGWDERSVFLWLFMGQRQAWATCHHWPTQTLSRSCLTPFRPCAGTSQPTGRGPPREMLLCLYKGHFVLSL